MGTDHPNEGVKRRKFLQTASAATAAGALLSKFEVAEAKESQIESLDQGSNRFAEIALSYEFAEDTEPDSHSDGSLPNYISDAENGQLTLINSDPSDLNDGINVAFRGDYYSHGAEYKGEERRSLVSNTQQWQVGTVSYHLSEKYQLPSWVVQEKGNSINLRVGNQEMTVQNEDEQTMAINQRSVKRRGDSAEVTPVVRLKNYGEVDVYGSSDMWVFPRSSGIPWVDSAITHYVYAGENDSRVETKKSQEFVLVDVEDA